MRDRCCRGVPALRYRRSTDASQDAHECRASLQLNWTRGLSVSLTENHRHRRGFGQAAIR
jgi:hypothetical protein